MWVLLRFLITDFMGLWLMKSVVLFVVAWKNWRLSVGGIDL